MMLWFAVAAALGVGGVVMIAVGWSVPPAPLAEIHRRLHSPRSRPAPTMAGHTGRLVRWVASTSSAKVADLAVTQRSPERHALDKIVYAIIVASLWTIPAVMLLAAGIDAPLAAHPVMVVLLAAGGYLWPEVELKVAARNARARWGHALATYLDVVAISLAGGAGIEDAMLDAADVGAGPELDRLAVTLETAQIRRDSNMWRALDELGVETDVTPLVELASAMQLAGESGARVRETLAAKAAALRTRELAEIEAAAQRSSETMGVAPALMAIAAVLLIGYPAIASFLTN